MKKPCTVQCGYSTHFANTVTVEAETLEEALDKAIETANADDAWRSTGHCSDTFVDAVCEGADADPRDPDAAWPIPDRFTERGEPPVITLTDPGRPDGGIAVSGVRVLIRFTGDAGTVSAELCDPPHPPANKPLVTIRRRADGAPDVTVTEGRARVRILDA